MTLDVVVKGFTQVYCDQEIVLFMKVSSLYVTF